MIIVTSRDFRANQSRYFDLAKEQDVIITSRDKGCYRLVPITEDDFLINKEELIAKIDKGIQEYKEGSYVSMDENESGVDFVNRILCSTK